MNNLHHFAHNTTLTSEDLIGRISENIAGASTHAYKAKRWSFADHMSGGTLDDGGISMKQGKQEPRPGEWTKLYLKGRGLFKVYDPVKREVYYSRLGDFHLNGEGTLVSKDGFDVIGFPLEGAVTHIRRAQMPNPDFMGINTNRNPFENDFGYVNYELNEAGRPIGRPQPINLALDPRNGKYLGLFDEVKVAEDGIIYGKDGNNLVSLYKISIHDFNNAESLTDVKDGLYFQPNRNTGMPTMASSRTKVFAEALEQSNVWVKMEAHYLTEAQRYYQFSTQAQKLADKITGTAIELIQ